MPLNGGNKENGDDEKNKWEKGERNRGDQFNVIGVATGHVAKTGNLYFQ